MHDNISFSLECQEHCYLLGYFWADCYLGKTKKGNYCFSFEIKEEDMLEIWPLLKNVGFNYLKTRKRKNSSKPQISVRYARQKELEPLIDWGFAEKEKGCKLYFLIPEENKRFFIKGFLDGDGSISLDKNGLFRVGFNGSKDQSWDFLEDFLSRIGLKYKIYRKIRKKSHPSHTRTHGYSVLEFTSLQEKIDFCKSIEDVRIGLSRKLKVFDLFKKIRIEQQKNRGFKQIVF